MINDFFGSCKNIFVKAVDKLKGSDRRIVLAEIADEYGYGGISLVARKALTRALRDLYFNTT
jgi:hypothetical protein